MMKWTLMICLLFVGLPMTQAMVDDEKKVTVHKDDDKGDEDPVNKDSIDLKKDRVSVEDTLVYEDFDIRKGDDSDGTDENMSTGDDDKKKGWVGCNIRTQGTVFYVDGIQVESLPEDNGNSKGFEIKPEINMYPNPATTGSRITVDIAGFDNPSLVVRTMTGQTLYTFDVSDSQAVLPQLATGTYLITVQDGGNSQTMRLLVQ